MSTQTSGATGGDPIRTAQSDERSNLDLFGKGPSSSEWTDEKHRLYLKSMEASFVQQLYTSLESNDLRSQKKQTVSHPTGQFKVHRNGCWQRIHEGASNEHQRMRCGGRTMYTCGLTNITHSSGVQAYQDPCSNKEYSGQNFDEEDNGGGGGGDSRVA